LGDVLVPLSEMGFVLEFWLEQVDTPWKLADTRR
jgi:hypothetical protein